MILIFCLSYLSLYQTIVLIEAFGVDNVKVIRGEEIITGDYANIDTLNDSYKIKSKNKKKVKALIINTDE